MKRFTFNTGRCYTAAGQIINAVYNEKEGYLFFNDTSRMITGRIALEPGFKAQLNLEYELMHAYDSNTYHSITQYTFDEQWKEAIDA